MDSQLGNAQPNRPDELPTKKNIYYIYAYIFLLDSDVDTKVSLDNNQLIALRALYIPN